MQKRWDRDPALQTSSMRVNVKDNPSRRKWLYIENEACLSEFWNIPVFKFY